MSRNNWQLLCEALWCAFVLVVWVYDLTQARSLFLAQPYPNGIQSANANLQMLFLFTGPLFALFPFILRVRPVEAMQLSKEPPNAELTLPKKTEDSSRYLEFLAVDFDPAQFFELNQEAR
jgi:hypothetical protein